MLLKSYRIEIMNNHCIPGAMTVNCIARTDQDISCAIPYLNAVLGGREYIKNPPAVVFQAQGKLISVQGDKITVNAVEDEAQARKIVEWIRREINEAWAKRGEIEPRYEGMAQPNLVEILKLLPKTNCRECGEQTCMVFATRVAEGAKGAESCPALEDENREVLEAYLDQFDLDY